MKTRLSSDYIVYSLFIGITSALIHMVTRYALHIKIGIKDKAAFSAGESVIQCIYVGIPTTIIGLGYAVAINLGGFEYVGITNKVLPALTSLLMPTIPSICRTLSIRFCVCIKPDDC